MIAWERVAELEQEVGAEDFAEIAHLFLSEIEEAIEELPSVNSPQGLSDVLHGIKGSSLNLGFEAVARIAAKGEGAPDTFAMDELARAVALSAEALRVRYPALP